MGNVHPMSPCSSARINMFTSSTWDVLGLKIHQRAAGIALSVLPGVARNWQEAHQGKEGKRISVTDFSHWAPFLTLSSCCLVSFVSAD